MSPSRFSINVLNVFAIGQMQCVLFVNAETFLAPLQRGQLQLFYCCKFTSRIDSHRLLLDEESLSCFLPCVNEIHPGPDLQFPVLTNASRANYVDTIILILSVHFRSMFTPLLKKPGLDTADVRSHRPISNLSVLSKMLERVVSKQLVNYLNINLLFP